MSQQRGYASRGRRGYGYDYESGGGRRDLRYGNDYGRYGTGLPGAAGYPAARWGWGPIGWMGWGPGMEYWPYAGLPAYGFDGRYEPPRRPPQESPTYGRRADRELRNWARRYGYELDYRIEPRLPPEHGRRDAARRR